MGVKLFRKFSIVSQQPEISVLNRDITGGQLKKILIFTFLFVEFVLFFTDLFAHLIDGSGQMPHIIISIQVDCVIIFPTTDVPCPFYQFSNGAVYKSQQKKSHKAGCQ